MVRYRRRIRLNAAAKSRYWNNVYNTNPMGYYRGRKTLRKKKWGKYSKYSTYPKTYRTKYSSYGSHYGRQRMVSEKVQTIVVDTHMNVNAFETQPFLNIKTLQVNDVSTTVPGCQSLDSLKSALPMSLYKNDQIVVVPDNETYNWHLKTLKSEVKITSVNVEDRTYMLSLYSPFGCSFRSIKDFNKLMYTNDIADEYRGGIIIFLECEDVPANTRVINMQSLYALDQPVFDLIEDYIFRDNDLYNSYITGFLLAGSGHFSYPFTRNVYYVQYSTVDGAGLANPTINACANYSFWDNELLPDMICFTVIKDMGLMYFVNRPAPAPFRDASRVFTQAGRIQFTQYTSYPSLSYLLQGLDLDQIISFSKWVAVVRLTTRANPPGWTVAERLGKFINEFFNRSDAIYDTAIENFQKLIDWGLIKVKPIKYAKTLDYLPQDRANMHFLVATGASVYHLRQTFSIDLTQAYLFFKANASKKHVFANLNPRLISFMRKRFPELICDK